MLTIRDLHVCYGPIAALRGVNLLVREGEVVALIGANGAGKTTLLKTISGLLNPKKGAIEFLEQSITRRPTHALVGKGLIHVPEGRAILREMTVLENLLMGAYARKDRKMVKADLERVLSIFPRLKERENQSGGTLSGGEQQMLAIGRALMGKPRLLLLDEPSLGLAPIIVRDIFNIIRDLREQGITILLVEQNATQALKVADRGYILELGVPVLEAKAAELLNNEAVVKAYLGSKEAS
ncbi:MAG: ABC transporter ATP-binding protein [Clostridia bacterium]|nr:ABC transporter ATP-binding protein [Clostridia bacterium]